MDVLQEAVALSQAGGFLRVYIDLGPRMQGLLNQLAKQSSNNAYINRILAAFPGSQFVKGTEIIQSPPGSRVRTTTNNPDFVEPLTAREFEVLTLLREPKSPKEIAGELNISYTTVKRHSINIYAKLEVRSRWEAVNKAVQLGILPPA